MAYSIPITVDGAAIGDLQVRPEADDVLVRIAIDRIHTPIATSAPDPAMGEWQALGARLAARGPHRLAIAAHAARAAASGGGDVSAEEERALVAWFSGLVDELIERGGGPVEDDAITERPGATAVWYAIAHAGPGRADRVGPGEPGFAAHVRSVAPVYMRSVIAAATPEEIGALRALVNAPADQLEIYRPFGRAFAPGYPPASESIERAIQHLTLRRPSARDLCGGVESWVFGFEIAASKHEIPGVSRIGALAWLACALRRMEGAR